MRRNTCLVDIVYFIVCPHADTEDEHLLIPPQKCIDDRKSGTITAPAMPERLTATALALRPRISACSGDRFTDKDALTAVQPFKITTSFRM